MLYDQIILMAHAFIQAYRILTIGYQKMSHVDCWELPEMNRSIKSTMLFESS